MTIEERIIKEEQKAGALDEVSKLSIVAHAKEANAKQAEECRQLAGWLRDYKRMKERRDSKRAVERFKEELQKLIAQKCDEINHYIAGCDSPFTYDQIGEVQEHLVGILDALGVKR